MTHQNVAYFHVVQSAPFAIVSALTIVKFQISDKKFGITMGISRVESVLKDEIIAFHIYADGFLSIDFSGQNHPG